MIKTIINNLSSKEIKEVKKYLKSYLSFYSVSNIDEASNDLLIEKVYDYLEASKIENSIRDKYIYKKYANTLSSFLKISSTKENKRISKYNDKLKQIKKIIEKNPDEENIDLLKDFSRIFLCLYTTQLNKPKGYKDNDFSFFLKDIKFNEVIDTFKKEKRGNEKYGKISLAIVVLSLIYTSILNETEEEGE